MAGAFESRAGPYEIRATLGANYLGNQRCLFRVWAPKASQVEIRVLSPQTGLFQMARSEAGYYEASVDGIEPGHLYLYRLDGTKELPDPASRCQPQGVHGLSQVVDPDFPWEDLSWSGLAPTGYIIYELHVGTFTRAGTLEAVIPHLKEVQDLGITTIELMPVAQFPGDRNWGYDGVYPFAVQNSYGGPKSLKRLVNACHQLGLAVILDVVYNHLGPEGNYLGQFGPYFTERYRSPWGPALNFDGPYSDEVRGFFIQNALYWLTEFHVDALRLDAVHAILDHSATPFLQELASTVDEAKKSLNRRIYLIPESASNDARLVRSRDLGGFGLSAQWSDDLHHCLHVLLTGEKKGYYEDFGSIEQLVKAFREGFVYSGQYSAHRRRRHGNSSREIPAERFVVFAQNHDQVGNRKRGERLAELVSFEGLKLAAGLVILSPFVPLLFMGEEYAEVAPFPYFTSHSDPKLAESVRQGREEEFAAFGWEGNLPDPQSEETFLCAKLNRQLRHEGRHRVLFEFYKEVIRLRKETPALARLSKEDLEAQGYEPEKVFLLRRWSEGSEALLISNFAQAQLSMTLPIPAGTWEKRLDSAEERWLGKGSVVPNELNSDGKASLNLNPMALVLFSRGREA